MEAPRLPGSLTPFPFQDVVRRLFLTDVSEKSLVSVLESVRFGHLGGVRLRCVRFSFLPQTQTRRSDIQTHRVLADEEFLPFRENTFDLVMSSLR